MDSDELIGCAIVLVVGFAPWPMAWYAHLPRQFAQTALDMCVVGVMVRYQPDAPASPLPSHVPR